MYCQKHLEIYLTTNKKALGFYFPVNKMGEHEDLNISSATSCLVSYNSILAQMFRNVLVETNVEFYCEKKNEKHI